VAIFVSQANDKKKEEEEERFGHWGWLRSTPMARGREIQPPPVAIFVSPANKTKTKKDRSNYTNPA
jgi:hypothetical protein